MQTGYLCCSLMTFKTDEFFAILFLKGICNKFDCSAQSWNDDVAQLVGRASASFDGIGHLYMAFSISASCRITLFGDR